MGVVCSAGSPGIDLNALSSARVNRGPSHSGLVRILFLSVLRYESISSVSSARRHAIDSGHLFFALPIEKGVKESKRTKDIEIVILQK